MEKQRPSYPQQIPPEDWEKTPASVKKQVMEMGQRIEKLEHVVAELLADQQRLLELVNRTSKNSSSPPSKDPPGLGKKPQKKNCSKKRGGQPGHEGHSRDLYPIEECTEVIDHYPESCACCGEDLSGKDTNPYRHQISRWAGKFLTM